MIIMPVLFYRRNYEFCIYFQNRPSSISVISASICVNNQFISLSSSFSIIRQLRNQSVFPQMLHGNFIKHTAYPYNA